MKLMPSRVMRSIYPEYYQTPQEVFERAKDQLFDLDAIA
jgi:hypothetical protein